MDDLMERAIEKVRGYLVRHQWTGYLVILPTPQLVEDFQHHLFSTGDTAGALYPSFCTFEGFVDAVVGMLDAPRIISEVEKQQILRRVMVDAETGGKLDYFRNVTGRPGLVDTVSRVIGELKRSACAPAEFTAKVKALGLKRLCDIALIYDSYQKVLEEWGIADRDDRYLLVLKALEERGLASLFPALEYAYIDWFPDANQVQRLIFERLKELLPSSDAAVGMDACHINDRNETAGIHLADVLFGPYGQTAAHPACVLGQGAEIEGEVRWVAFQVKKLLSSGEYKAEDVAIVVRSPDRYASTLRKVFAEARIPLSLDWREGLAGSLLVGGVRSLLDACTEAQQGVDLSAVASRLLMPSCAGNSMAGKGLSVGEKPLSEWGKLLQSPDSPLAAEDGKRLFQAIEMLTREKRPVREHVRVLKQALGLLGLERSVFACPEGISLKERAALALRDFKAWQAMMGVLDDMAWVDVNLSGGPKDIQDFAREFDSCLAAETYRPGVPDPQGIPVMSPTQIRGLSYRVVFILGLAEGEFPRTIRPSWAINDQERQALRPDILLPTSPELREREKLLFYLAIRACRERLFLSYVAAERDGSPGLASIFVEEVRARLPLLKDENLRLPHAEQLDQAVSLQEALLCLCQEGRFGQAQEVASRYGLSLEHPEQMRCVHDLRSGPDWSVYDGNLESAAAGDKLRQVYEGRVWAVTRLSNYLKCPMRLFFAELGLDSSPTGDESLTPQERGSLVHWMMQRLFAQPVDPDDPRLEERVREVMESVCGEKGLDGSQYPHPALWQLEREKVVQSVLALVIDERKRQQETGAATCQTEWPFGRGGTPTLTIADAAGSIGLSGQIDRIDVLPDGQLAIYDYKGGEGPSVKSVMQHEDIQLAVYMLAAREFLGNTEAGAYVSVRNGAPGARLAARDAAEKFAIGGRDGIFTEQEQLDQFLAETREILLSCQQRIMAGDFRPLPAGGACRNCDFAAICLYEPNRIRLKGARGEVTADD